MEWVKIYLSRDPNGPKERLLESKSAVDFLKLYFQDKDREEFLVLCLNAKNSVNAVNVVSVGSLSLNVVHPREVFKPAILSNASGIIVSHNHPSGDPNPSPEDRELTRRLVEAGRVMGIKVLDHLVIGEPDYYSFSDHGEI